MHNRPLPSHAIHKASHNRNSTPLIHTQRPIVLSTESLDGHNVVCSVPYPLPTPHLRIDIADHPSQRCTQLEGYRCRYPPNTSLSLCRRTQIHTHFANTMQADPPLHRPFSAEVKEIQHNNNNNNNRPPHAAPMAKAGRRVPDMREVRLLVVWSTHQTPTTTTRTPTHTQTQAQMQQHTHPTSPLPTRQIRMLSQKLSLLRFVNRSRIGLP